MGICFFLMPMANSFTIFAVLTLICGFVTGCQMVLPAVVLSEYLGADKTAVAFGLSNFLCGIITIIFRPLMIGKSKILSLETYPKYNTVKPVYLEYVDNWFLKIYLLK